MNTPGVRGPTGPGLLLAAALSLAWIVIPVTAPAGAAERRSSAAEPMRGAFLDAEGNVRSGPGTKARVLFVPARNAEFTVRDRQGPWFKVELDDGRKGWTHTKNIRIQDEHATGSTPKANSGEPALDPSIRTQISIDLDGDGLREDIALRRFESFGEAGGRYHLTVSRGEGRSRRILWEDSAHKFPCTIGDAGVEDLALVGDLDGDGKIELVIPGGRTDVGPQDFRILRWTGLRFELAHSGYFYGDADTPTRFACDPTAREGKVPVRWIARFESVEKPGSIRAQVVGFGKDFSEVVCGVARLAADGAGFKVDRWIEPLKTNP